MLTSMVVKNFKLFDEIEVELDRSVVFIGPNNSGKTSALQALALWSIGLAKWTEKRGVASSSAAKNRVGVAINRKDLLSIPLPRANLLWRDLHVRTRDESKKATSNIRVDIIVRGVTEDTSWECGLEFDYSNEESFYCRPLRRVGTGSGRMSVPPQAQKAHVAFLPPMSGLAAVEYHKQQGEIDVLMGQGQTAEVLRNLCFKVSQGQPSVWDGLKQHIHSLFGIELLDPELIAERSELLLRYRERSGAVLDISSSGRGLQQTLLLLTHIYNNPSSVLLIDEPDAHLEILRQRQIYQLVTEVAKEQEGQVICASHSEVVLNEAAGRDTVIAFVGKPHRIDEQASQVLKSLRDIGFDQYYQAEQTGWVLYLEGSTDLAILRTFARMLNHEATAHLERPFVYYCGNDPQRAHHHFYGLREALPALVGIALFDNLGRQLDQAEALTELQWQKREIENYFCLPGVLRAYARGEEDSDLWTNAEADSRERQMESAIKEVEEALQVLGEPSPWSGTIKASSQFLDRVFERYYDKLGLAVAFRKKHYYELASLVPAEELDTEISDKLDAIVATARRVLPVEERG